MGTDVEVLADGLGCPEGPDLLPDGTVVFVETFRRRVSAWDPSDGLRSFADVGGAPTACVVGIDGVYVAQNGLTAGPWRSPDPTPPSIQRIGDDGRVDLVVETADGRPLVGPNDLCFGPDGRLYFTDPGVFDPERPDPGTVCVVEPDGTSRVLVDVGPTFPNGIVIERDGSVVWNESYTRRIRRRRPDGTVETITTLPADRVPDGMKVAEDGRLFVAGVTSGGIDVLASDGAAVGFVEAGDGPLNLVFDGRDLLVTDFGAWSHEAELAEEMKGRLLRVPVGVGGMPPHPGSIA